MIKLVFYSLLLIFWIKVHLNIDDISNKLYFFAL
jgi:hypothetical protein